MEGDGAPSRSTGRVRRWAHIRFAPEVAQRVPQEQRCEVFWPAASLTGSVSTDSGDSGIQPMAPVPHQRSREQGCDLLFTFQKIDSCRIKTHIKMRSPQYFQR